MQSAEGVLLKPQNGKKLSYSHLWRVLKSTNYIPTKKSDTEDRKICMLLPINRQHTAVKVKLPEYPPDGRNKLQASENEFMTSAHKEECSQTMHKMFVTARRHLRKITCVFIGKKEIPLQVWTGFEGSRRLRLQISRQSAQEGGKVVNPMYRPYLPHRKYSYYSFLLWAGIFQSV
jgi:hypothetical protein